MSETKKTIADVVKKPQEIAPDWQKLYVDECAKTKVLENKIAEYEKLCKSYAENARQSAEILQRATLEYNARIQFMLDCARHAYLSMQFAENAAEAKKGGKQ